jgi:hypothetical protein
MQREDEGTPASAQHVDSPADSDSDLQEGQAALGDRQHHDRPLAGVPDGFGPAGQRLA